MRYAVVRPFETMIGMTATVRDFVRARGSPAYTKGQ